MKLTHLSFVRCVRGRDVPAPPSPEERLQHFRAAWPAPKANTWPWKWQCPKPSAARRPARAALRVISSRPRS